MRALPSVLICCLLFPFRIVSSHDLHHRQSFIEQFTLLVSILYIDKPVSVTRERQRVRGGGGGDGAGRVRACMRVCVSVPERACERECVYMREREERERECVCVCANVHACVRWRCIPCDIYARVFPHVLATKGMKHGKSS